MERSKGLNNHKLTNIRGKRTEAQRVADTAFCVSLFLKGYNYEVITKELNARNAELGLGYSLSVMQIHSDLRQRQDEWLREIADNISLYYTQELAKIDFWEREATEAWEKSKGDKLRTKTSGGTLDKMTKKMAGGAIKEQESATSHGDPRYAKLALEFMQQREKLLARAFDSVMAKPAEGTTTSPIERKAIPEELRSQLIKHLQGIPALPEQPAIDTTAEAISSETKYSDGPTWDGPEPEDIESEEVIDEQEPEVEPGQPVLTLGEES